MGLGRPDAEAVLAAAAPPSCPRERAEWAFDRFAGPVLGYLRRMLRDPDDAEALAQEVFCRALQATGSFPTEASVRSWLFRVARNLAFDFAKKGRPRPMSTVADHELTERVDSGSKSSFAVALERDEEIAAMHDALGSLPEIYRSTLVLRFFEDWTYEQIAEIEGVSESALRTRTHKGLALLREALTREDSPPPRSLRTKPERKRLN